MLKRCCEGAHGFSATDETIERSPALAIVDLSVPILDSVETTSVVHCPVPVIKTSAWLSFLRESFVGRYLIVRATR